MGIFAQTAKYVLHSIFEAFLNVATIKKTPVLKRKELYQGLIEPGWGAGLWIPLREESGNIYYKTPLTLKSFLSEKCYEALYRFVVKAVWSRRREGVLHDRERA